MQIMKGNGAVGILHSEIRGRGADQAQPGLVIAAGKSRGYNGQK